MALLVPGALSAQAALPVRGTPSAWGGVEFDPRIHDSAFLDEIDLYSELIIVAAATTGTMSNAAIDSALGVVTLVS